MNLYTCKYNLLTLNNYLNYTYSYYIFPLSRSFLDDRQHFFDYFKTNQFICKHTTQCLLSNTFILFSTLFVHDLKFEVRQFIFECSVFVRAVVSKFKPCQ